MMQGTMS